MDRNEYRWYRLDNAAILFPAVSNRDNANVFRISVILKEKVVPTLLQEALLVTIQQFPSFRVKMRKGVFWRYLEYNSAEPTVQKEEDTPCARLHEKENDGYLFRVTYFEKKISLEVYHTITDGNGAVAFLRTLTVEYLKWLHPEEVPADADIVGLPDSSRRKTEDSYMVNYDPNQKKRTRVSRAYQIPGTTFFETHTKVIQGVMPVGELLRRAKEYQVSLTAYMGAVLIYAIHRGCLDGRPSKYPIQLSIPVDMRSRVGSQTTRNFFICVVVGVMPKKRDMSFESIVKEVGEKLKIELGEQSLLEKMNFQVSIEKNPLIRFCPLFLKDFILKLVYKGGTHQYTCTMSNLGKLHIQEQADRYVDSMECMLGTSKDHAMKTGMCSFGQELVFTFTTSIEETDVEREFFRFLSEQGISVTVRSNMKE